MTQIISYSNFQLVWMADINFFFHLDLYCNCIVVYSINFEIH